MTEWISVAIDIAVTASAGMCGITLFGAGRCGHFLGVAVCMRFLNYNAAAYDLKADRLFIVIISISITAAQGHFCLAACTVEHLELKLKYFAVIGAVIISDPNGACFYCPAGESAVFKADEFKLFSIVVYAKCQNRNTGVIDCADTQCHLIASLCGLRRDDKLRRTVGKCSAHSGEE